ncbi:MAG: hypothetical protein QOC61_127 [Acidobacteriota bacterium]|jgi:type IV secretory pathway TrbL component|nr:hypothetical protein [Acidobacteriota bacterium]MDT5261123.1 hypothetical protein [Acidobacteriota bacterium]MDT7780642.1 hypothetical protein [Acidobacteriota bacterium]
MKPVIVLALAWVIIIGALMIIPYNGGIVVECIACGAMLTRVLGLISIVIGVAGFMAGKNAGAGR